MNDSLLMKKEKKEIRQSESHYMPSEVFFDWPVEYPWRRWRRWKTVPISLMKTEDVSVITIPGAKKYRYVSFGPDDKLPFEIIRLIGVDEVMSQNKLFSMSLRAMVLVRSIWISLRKNRLRTKKLRSGYYITAYLLSCLNRRLMSSTFLLRFRSYPFQ